MLEDVPLSVENSSLNICSSTKWLSTSEPSLLNIISSNWGTDESSRGLGWVEGSVINIDFFSMKIGVTRVSKGVTLLIISRREDRFIYSLKRNGIYDITRQQRGSKLDGGK